MRPKIVVAVILLAALVLVGVYFLRDALSRPPAPLESAPVQATPIVKVATPTVEPERPQPMIQAPPPVAPAPVAPTVPVAVVSTNQVTQDPAAIAATVQKLEELEWNNDPASLQAILTELTNSSQTVRHVAIEAAIQFRDRSAIPILKNLAGQAESPEEKKELLDAAEFLALPTISEVRAQKNQQGAK